MASAKECDRCGELYKEKTIFSDYIAEHKNLIFHQYDLCPKCFSSFREWFDKYKQKEEDNAG